MISIGEVIIFQKCIANISVKQKICEDTFLRAVKGRKIVALSYTILDNCSRIRSLWMVRRRQKLTTKSLDSRAMFEMRLIKCLEFKIWDDLFHVNDEDFYQIFGKVVKIEYIWEPTKLTIVLRGLSDLRIWKSSPHKNQIPLSSIVMEVDAPFN